MMFKPMFKDDQFKKIFPHFHLSQFEKGWEKKEREN